MEFKRLKITFSSSSDLQSFDVVVISIFLLFFKEGVNIKGWYIFGLEGGENKRDDEFNELGENLRDGNQR